MSNTITNTAESSINFKPLAEALGYALLNTSLDEATRNYVVRHVASALANVTEEAYVCFDADDFEDIANGR